MLLADAGLFQDVLWALEGESYGNSMDYVNGNNPFYNDVVGQFGSWANGRTDANGAYGVHVINLYNDCGIGQSQLIYLGSPPPTVPETGTLLVSSFLLLHSDWFDGSQTLCLND